MLLFFHKSYFRRTFFVFPVLFAFQGLQHPFFEHLFWQKFFKLFGSPYFFNFFRIILVGAFINKRARLLQSLIFFFFFKDRLDATNVKINVQLLITVLNYWTGAFRIVQRVPPFKYSIFIVRYKRRNYRVPPLSFFGTVRIFYRNFFLSPKSPPFTFFDILQQIEVSKSPKGLPFQVFRHYETGSSFLFFDFSFFSRIYFFNVWKGSPFNF